MDHVLAALITILSLICLLVWAGLAWRRGKHREKKLRGLAAKSSLRFSSSDPFDLPDVHFHLNIFTQGHSRLARNVVHGRLGALAVRLLDYQYETGTGKNRRTHQWQVALVQTGMRLPGLLCRPMPDHDPLEILFGFDEIDFQAEPFARLFHVTGEDRAFAYHLLHARATDQLAAQPRFNLETRGPMVAVYNSGLLPPTEAISMLRFAIQFVEAIPSSLADELRDDQTEPETQEI